MKLQGQVTGEVPLVGNRFVDSIDRRHRAGQGGIECAVTAI